MPQQILNIPSSSGKQNLAYLNLLPCKVHHDGDLGPSGGLWKVDTNEDGNKTAYLRGRKLQGTAMKLPNSYYGVVVEMSEKEFEASEQPIAHDGNNEGNDSQEPRETIEVAPLNKKAQFDEVVIWGHESMPDSSADPFVRGAEEWITFAEQVHSFATGDEAVEKTGGS